LGGKMSSILLSLMFLYRALNYIVTLQGSWQGFISNIGGLLASVELIDEFKKGKEKIDRTHPVEKVTTLELADLSFAYPSGFKVLDKINISLDPLKTYAFVGESGSGKTTLVNLVIGLLSPSEGHIIVNGMERNKVDISTYRRKFGYITQESVIFNDTLFNNITLWSEKTPENIQLFQNAIKLANLQEFLEDLPEKEETFLGDNGILISGGQ
ncbi:MAG TPA: ABC transporter ATP-binding protein, partial [Algoriphagus sp.]|nr:ABC transporter ATP-binding protein [Algoriphagus sp.]